MGELAEAHTLLDVNAKSRAIVDRVAVMETRGAELTFGRCALIDRSGTTARLLSRQGPGIEAEQAWRALIHCNPDNTSYYYGFFSSNKIDLGKICLVFWRIFFSSPVCLLITIRSCYRH
jgi:N-alpha-acetyltransferase 15/16, NatA auxiliary subunit